MKSDITTLIVGVLMFIIGIVFRVYVSRNRFYRRGEGGSQRFSSYSQSVTTTAFETFLKLVGTVLVIGGLFFCFVAWYNIRAITHHNSTENSDTTGVTSKKSK